MKFTSAYDVLDMAGTTSVYWSNVDEKQQRHDGVFKMTSSYMYSAMIYS